MEPAPPEQNGSGPLDTRLQEAWRNLAPQLPRQRIIIECTTPELVGTNEMGAYLRGLSTVLSMTPLSEPFVYPATSDDGMFMGYGGWIHWVTSGAHVYSYPADCASPPLERP